MIGKSPIHIYMNLLFMILYRGLAIYHKDYIQEFIRI